MAAILTITITDAAREPVGELHTGDPRGDCWDYIVRTYGPQEPEGETRDANGYLVGVDALIAEWIQDRAGRERTLCLPV